MAETRAEADNGKPFKSGSVIYNPGVGEEDVTRAFGRIFRKGEAVEIDDEQVFNKLKNNPQFEDAGAKKGREAEAKRKAAEKDKLDKELDGRTKEARKLRDEALGKQSEADAAERARKALEDAAHDPDDETVKLR